MIECHPTPLRMMVFVLLFSTSLHLISFRSSQPLLSLLIMRHFLVARQSGAPPNSSGGATGGSKAPSADYVPIPDSVLLIFLVALSIFAILIWLNLPRHIARLSSGTQAGDLFKGYWFANNGKRNSPVRQYAIGLEQEEQRAPKHFPSWGEIIPGSSAFRREIPFTRGNTIGQMGTLVVYAGLVGAAIAIEE